jgi:hypothetical protein
MKLLLVGVAAVLLAGCVAVTPTPPVLSKGDAVARARVVYGAGLATGGSRLELPANNTGTGPHDFYNLFARFPIGSDAVYGVSIATATNLAHTNTEVTAGELGKLEVEGQQQLTVRGNKVEYVEATFDRAFLDKAGNKGAKIQITSSSGSITFNVPDWMFAALIEAADQNDIVGTLHRDERKREQERQQIRSAYVQAHPERPEKIKTAIADGKIILGMSADDTRASWGQPDKVNRTVTAGGVSEQWVYGDTYVYFEDSILTSWQDTR